MSITTQLWLAIRLAAEIATSAHCQTWSGVRCVLPRARPTIELIAGWHEISPGVPVCTVGAECSAKEWEP